MSGLEIQIRTIGINHYQVIEDQSDLDLIYAILKKVEHMAVRVVIKNETLNYDEGEE